MIGFLSKVFGSCVSSHEYVLPGSAPFYLATGYTTEKIALNNSECLLITPIDADSRLPVLKKHLAKMCEISGLPCALNLEKLTAKQRENLISENVPFVSVQQIYLPFWGAVFSARLNTPPKEPVTMTPTTQLVFLYAYYSLLAGQKLSATIVTSKLKLPKSSVSKAIQDLTACKLFSANADGTNKWISLNGNPSDVLTRALRLMRNPIRKEIWLKSVPEDIPYMLGGIRALAESSMLVSNERDGALVFSKENAKLLPPELLISKRDYDDFGGIAAEIWIYDPYFLSNGNIVDEISLYICLMSSEDERIQKELDMIRDKYGLSMEEN